MQTLLGHSAPSLHFSLDGCSLVRHASSFSRIHKPPPTLWVFQELMLMLSLTYSKMIRLISGRWRYVSNMQSIHVELYDKYEALKCYRQRLLTSRLNANKCKSCLLPKKKFERIRGEDGIKRRGRYQVKRTILNCAHPHPPSCPHFESRVGLTGFCLLGRSVEFGQHHEFVHIV